MHNNAITFLTNCFSIIQPEIAENLSNLEASDQERDFIERFTKSPDLELLAPVNDLFNDIGKRFEHEKPEDRAMESFDYLESSAIAKDLNLRLWCLTYAAIKILKTNEIKTDCSVCFCIDREETPIYSSLSHTQALDHFNNMPDKKRKGREITLLAFVQTNTHNLRVPLLIKRGS